jgi:hypothetical protein
MQISDKQSFYSEINRLKKVFIAFEIISIKLDK